MLVKDILIHFLWKLLTESLLNVEGKVVILDFKDLEVDFSVGEGGLV